MRTNSAAWLAAIAVALAGGVCTAAAQTVWTTQAGEVCDEGRGDDERVCEVREATLPAGGRLTVDGGANGGVRVEGWDGTEIRARAHVWTRARSAERARELLGEVALEAGGGTLRASGPDRERRESWGVTWEVMVPRSTDLSLETVNGGISVRDVTGVITFDAMNGGVSLVEVGGDVRGRTRNGSLSVTLAGSTWNGRGLDAETANGGVRIAVPEGYSAELETGTVNGRVEMGFPVMVEGRIGRDIRTVLGEGGPLIRATTTNGNVRVTRP